MYVSFPGFSSYDGSYTVYYAGTESPNHAVLIVGWDDSLTYTGGTGGWIVKNSWGTDWGGPCGYGTERGYFTIAYGSASIGMYSSFVYDWQDYDSSGDVLHYDEGGNSDAWGCEGSTTAWGLVKFTPSDDTQVTRVEFWTSDATTDVDVYLYDDFDGSTPSGLLAQELNNSFYEAGYHSVALASPLSVNDGDDIIAVVKLTNDSFGFPVVADLYGPHETGRTYISCNGSSWMDLGTHSTDPEDIAIRLRTSESGGPVTPTPTSTATATPTSTPTATATPTHTPPPEPAPNVGLDKAVTGRDFEPGDPITFTLAIANTGDKIASGVVITDIVPTEVLAPSFATTLELTQVGGVPYVWAVEPLGIGQGGAITITGWIDPGRASGFAFSNMAAITDPEDATPGNNNSTAVVVVGGYKVYLPLVMKRWPPIPDVPALDPITNPDGDGNYTVRWGTAHLADTYALQEDDNAAFSSPAVRYAGSGTSWVASGQATGTYYYRVLARNSWGESGWSNSQPVIVQGAQWITIVSDDFEGSFPGSVWEVGDLNSDSGHYYWGKRDCRDQGGAYSAWCVGAGDSAVSCGSDYRNHMFSWMVYGPFSLAGASAAELTFDWWSDTEPEYDEFFWGASTDGTDFHGLAVSGDWSSWRTGELLDFTAVPTLGSLLGEDQVWIAFAFLSDYSVTDRGSFVDNALLRKRVGGAASTGGERAPATQHVLQPNQTLRFANLRLDR